MRISKSRLASRGASYHMNQTTLAETVPMLREAFFDAYWEELEKMGWSAVVLHSWQNLPQTIESDVDYAVAGVGAGELLRFLGEFSRSRGWRLIQVIEHEPGAYYCVCMQAAPPYSHLELDVAWNYRRSGHVLVASEVLLGGRRRAKGKSFMIPSAGGELCYLFAKAAAKGKDFVEIRDRVAELLDEDSVGCRSAVVKAFGDGLLTSDRSTETLEYWASWFAVAPCFRAVRAGRRFGLAEMFLYLRRIFHPTGFRVTVRQSADSAEAQLVVETFAPAFRRVFKRGPVALWEWPGILICLIRTSLMIEGGSEGSHAADLSDERALGEILESRVRRIARQLPSP